MCCVGLRQRGNGTQLSTFFNASMNSCDMYCLKSSKVKWIISRRGVVHLSSFNAPSSELLFKMLKQFTPFFQILTPFQAVEQRDPTKQGCQPAWTYVFQFSFCISCRGGFKPHVDGFKQHWRSHQFRFHPFALLTWPEPHAWLLPYLPLSSRPSPPHVPHQLPTWTVPCGQRNFQVPERHKPGGATKDCMAEKLWRHEDLWRILKDWQNHGIAPWRPERPSENHS